MAPKPPHRQLAVPRQIDPRLPRWWEMAVVAFSLLSVLLFLIDWGFEHRPPRWLYLADLLVSLLFLIDFGVRLARSQQRWAFVREHGVDLLGAIPIIEPLHTLRLVRFVRLVRLWRAGSRLRRSSDLIIPEALDRLGVATLVVWMTTALVFYLLEHGKNPNLKTISDALWWSMTTLSTVGYGDISPVTPLGRLVGMATMILGVGFLGALAATLATMLIDLRDRGRNGLRSYTLQEHLLVLGWNPRAPSAIKDFCLDPRYRAMPVVIVADLEKTPVDDPQIRFVRGNPGRREVLDRASAAAASVALIFPADLTDPGGDLQTALTALTLRKMNPSVKIGAELIDPGNRSYLDDVGCDAIVDVASFGTMLMVRGIQDIGAIDVVEDLLTNQGGSELYRVAVPAGALGKTFRAHARELLDRDCSAIGLERDGARELNPDGDTVLRGGDHLIVVAREPP